MAFVVPMALFVAVDSPGTVPKWLIQQGLHPKRNFIVQGVDIEAAFWDSGFGWQHAQRRTRARRATLRRYSVASA